jgi:hypothetical protein
MDLRGEGFVSRVLLLLLFSALYMTATLVEGEFMVPVRDHPMATHVVKFRAERFLETY